MPSFEHYRQEAEATIRGMLHDAKFGPNPLADPQNHHDAAFGAEGQAYREKALRALAIAKSSTAGIAARCALAWLEGCHAPPATREAERAAPVAVRRPQ